tara:strand:- start:3907 stop:4695 length:789 start_codon:yes stop_codon:yes gene_type:complete
MSDSLYRYFGGTSYPVDGAQVENTNLFSVSDPGRDKLIALFKTAINMELAQSTTLVQPASAWAAVTPSTALDGILPVSDTTYDMPRKSVLRETKLTYPLLALYRTSATHDEFTLAQEQITQLWGFDYILGPLSVADFRRLGGALNAVKTIVQLCIRRRGHPAYQNGALQFGKGSGNFSTVQITESSEGVANYGQEAEGMEFFSLHMVLKTTEHDGIVEGTVPDLEGASVSIGVGSQSEILPDAINVNTSVPLSPNHGTPEPR